MKTVIIELDRICFDWTQRLERCRKDDGTVDWDRAFSNHEVEKDPAIKGAAEATFSIARRGFRIVYLTGRSNKCRGATWNALYDGRFILPSLDRIPHRLEMRDYDDLRPDAEVKKERIHWLKMLPLNETLKCRFYDFVAAIDDDYNGTLKPMYESLGIPCFLSFDEFFESERRRSVDAR